MMGTREPLSRGAQDEEIVEAPFRSYAQDRSGSPRFHIRLVENRSGLYPPHKHDYFQILFFMTEAPVLRVGLTSHVPRPGSIYFVAPMVPHQVRFDAGTRCVVLYFDLDFIRPTITRSYPVSELVRIAPELTPFAWQNHVPFDLNADQAQRVRRSMEAMIRQHDEERICAGEITRAELTLMLATLCQDYEAEFLELSARLPIVGRDSAHMRRISEFIGSNYVRGPSLDEAARAVSLSKSRLCALIRRYTGTTFNVLIRDMRVEDACEQLKLTDKPIGHIAYEVGYNDQKYFHRAFKSALGMTPSAYRLAQAKARASAGATPAQGKAAPLRLIV